MWPTVQDVVPHGGKVLGTGPGYIVSALEKQIMRDAWAHLTSSFLCDLGPQARELDCHIWAILRT